MLEHLGGEIVLQPLGDAHQFRGARRRCVGGGRRRQGSLRVLRQLGLARRHVGRALRRERDLRRVAREFVRRRRDRLRRFDDLRAQRRRGERDSNLRAGLSGRRALRRFAAHELNGLPGFTVVRDQAAGSLPATARRWSDIAVFARRPRPAGLDDMGVEGRSDIGRSRCRPHARRSWTALFRPPGALGASDGDAEKLGAAAQIERTLSCLTNWREATWVVRSRFARQVAQACPPRCPIPDQREVNRIAEKRVSGKPANGGNQDKTAT